MNTWVHPLPVTGWLSWLAVLLTIGFPTIAVSQTAIPQPTKTLKIGIAGCDTSHVVAFTRLINHPEAEGALSRMTVVAAFPGGSPDLEASATRLDGFTEQLRGLGVTIVDDCQQLTQQCDAFLLESVDGRAHLTLFRQLACGKPIFVDKPAAASLRDLLAIQQLAEDTDTPWFTSSALRYCDQVTELQKSPPLSNGAPITAVETSSPYKTESHHPDLFWYGIHGVESLFALMGPGCESVSCVEGNQLVATGIWNDGRLGTYRGIKTPTNNDAYRFTVYGQKEINQISGFSGYAGLVREIGDFLESGKPAVDFEQTVQMFAFMEAAQESKKRQGQHVSLQWAVQRAQQSLPTPEPGSLPDVEAKQQP